MTGFGDDWSEFARHVHDPLWRITHDHVDKLDPLRGSLFEEVSDEDDESEPKTQRQDEDDDEDFE